MNVTKLTTPVDRLHQIAKVLRESACGPLIVAHEVLKIAANWERHRLEMPPQDQKLSASEALKKHLGYGLQWFKVRARAVDLLGEDVRRWMSHECALWIVGLVPEDRLASVKEHLLSVIPLHKRRKAGCPITKAQARNAVHAFIGHEPKSKVCAQCKRLRKMVRDLGGDPDE